MLRQPESFLEVVIHRLDPLPGLTALFAGYEGGEWRADRFSEHIMEWLPEFALNWSEYRTLNHANAVPLMKRAAQILYNTEKYKRRGEFGEILLHIAMRQIFQTVPAISKLYYKSAANDTVKGFDAVHVVATSKELELWLGEAKFYARISDAIRDVTNELKAHTTANYLRDEFIPITNKIDDGWPHFQQLQKLLHPNTSLDEVFARTVFPVLLTYESAVANSFTTASEEFSSQLHRELERNYDSFVESGLPPNIRVHLFLLPLADKQVLLRELHERLRAWQSI